MGTIATRWLGIAVIMTHCDGKKDEPIQILRDRGMRVTPQRIAVLQTVEVSGNHPAAEMAYQHVCGEYPRISRDTVYRILSVMEKD